MTGCAGAPGGTTPQISRSANTSARAIDSMIADAQAGTAALKAELRGRANVVKTADGAEIYTSGRLVDTVHEHADGSTTHIFATGSTVNVPSPLTRTIRPMVLQNQGTCSDMLTLINADQTRLDWATAAVILAVGAGLAAVFFSVGSLTGPVAAANAVVLGIYITDKTALDSAQLAYAQAGC